MIDPYWMHAGPEDCQAAEAKLSRIAVLCDQPREWDVNDADSAEARSARAYNSALAKVEAILKQVEPS